MSLANRIALMIVGLLGAGGLLAGAAFHQAVRRSLLAELDGRLDARLAWLEGAVEVDDDEIELEVPAHPEPPDVAEHWQVVTAEGDVLWASPTGMDTADMVARSRTRRFGNRHDEPDGDASPSPAGLDLVLIAGTSSLGMQSEMARLMRALWTVGPLAMVVCGGLLVLVIRRQLRPLARMAGEAGAIGPGNLSARIGPAGSSTECVRLRSAVNAMVERLAEGLERERQFASSAAHELRTPVAQLRTQIEVAMRRERTAEEYQEALRGALADVERLQNLVAGLLQLTRGQERAAGKPVSVERLLDEVARQMAFEPFPTTGALTDLWVQGEENLLSSALVNLLDNAHRYAPGELPNVTVEPRDDHLLLVVADHGPGIPEDELGRIFAPLTRLDQSRSIHESPDGFGLGLAVARTTARAFGGDLICRARRDGTPGAEFVLRLRRVDRDAPPSRSGLPTPSVVAESVAPPP